MRPVVFLYWPWLLLVVQITWPSFGCGVRMAGSKAVVAPEVLSSQVLHRAVSGAWIISNFWAVR